MATSDKNKTEVVDTWWLIETKVAIVIVNGNVLIMNDQKLAKIHTVSKTEIVKYEPTWFMSQVRTVVIAGTVLRNYVQLKWSC